MQEIIQNIKNFIMTFGSARITKIKEGVFPTIDPT